MNNVLDNNIQMMENKTAYLEYSNIFPTIFRYLIIAALYVTIFMNFKKPSIQFLLFIAVFILNFFTLVFVFKDLFSTPLLMKAIYNQLPVNSDYNNSFSLYFIIIILATLGLFICSIAIILSVFSYGKTSTNDYKSYTLTAHNALLLSQFEASYFTYIVYLTMFIFFIIFAHTSGPTKHLMFNIGCLFFSFIIVITSVYCCMASVNFLKIKQYKRQLYE